ncbi:MAG: hypothetical protein NXH73_05020 [Flavobacteriaceae bacterium]|nr:hypothetical protein [Flavobacteriaceae bacterium]
MNLRKYSFAIIKAVILLLGLNLVSCSSLVKTKIENKSYSPLSKHVDVYAFYEMKVPENSQYVGEIEFKDTAFTQKCSYEDVIEQSKQIARESGANLIHIIESKEPGMGTSVCYRMKAKLYRNVDFETLEVIKEKISLRYKSQLPEDADYAKVYFYRPSLSYGFLVGYKVRYQDSIIGRLRNGEKFEFKTKEFGYREFKAMTENESSIYLNIQPGGEYFVKCAIKAGFLVGVPTMEEKDSYRGRIEYNML